MVMTCGNDEEYAYIREAKEKVVQDDVTGEYYLLKEFPNMTPAKLKGKGANVLVIMTKARKFKLRGESTPYIIKWANRLNELLKTTQTVGGMWNDEEETTRDDSVFTRTASMVSHDSRASSGTMETHNEAGTDEELEDVEPYNEHDPDVVEGERQSYDFPSDDTKGATTSDGKSKPSRRFSLKQGGLLDEDESQKGSASKSCCAVC
mmetsp:Transcript_1681/g.3608  ORF Transcript_1681/g.3608 Transcript_1681/m.3608 type:complete len:206 (-) Transcript_1681:435-1052(-)